MESEKTGFFHLCPLLEVGEEKDASSQIEYWIKQQEISLHTLEKCNVHNPLKEAMHNIIAVLKFHIPHKQMEAIEKLEHLHEQTDCLNINTCSNLFYMYNNIHQENADYLKLASILKEKMNNSSDNLENARGICERAYFCKFQAEEGITNNEEYSKSAQIMNDGITLGSRFGMSQTELSVWKYHLFDLQREMLNLHASENSPEDRNKDKAIHHFDLMSKSFVNFYVHSNEQCVFYKSRALVDVILTMVKHQDLLTVLPNYESICEELILGDIWKDYFLAMEEALCMSSCDYMIPLKISYVYGILHKPQESLKYANMASEMEEGFNMAATHAKMVSCARLAREYDNSNENIARKYLEMAYKEGKQIMDKQGRVSQSCATELAMVCFLMATDRSTNIWTIYPGKAEYIKEAIELNKLALKQDKGRMNQRTWKQLGECYWVQGEYDKAFPCIRSACLSFASINPAYLKPNLKSLLQKYCIVIKNKKAEKFRYINMMVDDLEKMWEYITTYDSLGFLVVSSVRKLNKNIACVLRVLHQRQSAESRRILLELCDMIKKSDIIPESISCLCEEVKLELQI